MGRVLAFLVIFSFYPLALQARTFLERCVLLLANPPSTEQLIKEKRYQEAIWQLYEEGNQVESLKLRGDVIKMIQTGIIVARVPLESGMHNDGKIILHNGLSGILKKNQTYYGREVFAYELDQALELNRVPITVEYEADGIIGSFQLWVDESQDGSSIFTRLRFFYASLSEYNFFQYLIGQFDYHNGNYLFTKNGRIVFTDSGHTFIADGSPPEGDIKNYIPSKRVFENLKNLDLSMIEERLKATLPENDILTSFETAYPDFLSRREHLIRLIEREVEVRGEGIFLNSNRP